MTLETFKTIITTMELPQMREAFVQNGFRWANPDAVWEFPYTTIEKNCEALSDIKYEDVFANTLYHATLYKGLPKQEYDGLTFLLLIVHRIHRERNIPIPYKKFLYTNAPTNEAYERDIRSIVRCEGCKRKYVKKNLVKYENKLLCGKCVLKKALK